jgi:hypothetical protein
VLFLLFGANCGYSQKGVTAKKVFHLLVRHFTGCSNIMGLYVAALNYFLAQQHMKKYQCFNINKIREDDQQFLPSHAILINNSLCIFHTPWVLRLGAV